jgi:hypothetical protein
MSFAIYAAPFENNGNNYKLIDNDNDDYINNKKTAKNKTQKKRSLDEKINPDVLNTIQQIHNTISTNDEEDLNDFIPPPPSLSAGAERLEMREEIENKESEEELNNNEQQYSTPYSKQYYNQFMSNKMLSNNTIDDSAYPSSIQPDQFRKNIPDNEMFDKMNYMIHLLEDQQAKKTEHVTEEIVLYSFLGIFTIFVVDSFARVGKYVR